MSDSHAVNPYTATATLVDDDKRLDFLPFYFGVKMMIVGEAYVYQFMRDLSEGQYTGGYWNYYEVSSGTFYLALKGDERFTLTSPSGQTETMSADAAGIVCTLYTLGRLAALVGKEEFVDMYHLLIAYSSNHPESTAIRALID